MWIRSVRAHPFGPIGDDTIELAPGLTVICGDNESGKSSWHSAVTTALTGRRKGRTRNVDRAFAERHRPWHHDGWAVSCVVTMADGRSVRLVHDLARSTSQAIDDATGADITAELANEGGVDVAQLVGLSRATLPLVSSVRQAEVLALAAAANDGDALGALRGFLQQSISSRSETETTAEVALERLAWFRQGAIGSERKGSGKPLRAAFDAVETTERQLKRSIHEWEEHKEGQRELARLEAAATELTADVLRRRVAVVAASCAQAEAELAEVRKLRLVTASDEPKLATAEQIDAGRKALVAYEQLPSTPAEAIRAPDASLPDAATLEATLAGLPSLPSGDLEPRPDVLRQADDYRRAVARLEAHDASEPAGTDDTRGPATDLDPAQLRELAHELERPAVHEPVAERARLAELEADGSNVSPSPWARPAVAFGLLALLAAMAVIAGLIAAPGGTVAALVVVGVGAIAGGVALTLTAKPSQVLLTETAQARYALAQAEQSHASASSHRNLLLTGLADRRLPTEAGALRQLATERENGATRVEALRRWQGRRSKLITDVDSRGEALSLALRSADAVPAQEADAPFVGVGDKPAMVLAQVDAYVAGCGRRRALAAEADRRDGLLAQLEARQQLDRQHDSAVLRQERVHGRIVQLATNLGDAPDATPAAMVATIRGWLAEQSSLDDQHRQLAEARARLQGILAGRSVEDLLVAVEGDRAELDSLMAEAGIAPGSLPPASGAAPDQASLREAEVQLASLSGKISELRGRLDAIESRIHDLTEVRETHERAVTEYERLQRLGGLVGQTDQFLRTAREAVHRDIAPAIAEATKHHLATVSGGRYKELRVNPDDLSVQVQLADGSWRLADRLSHGTAEQIYLLVRAAIAEIVAPGAESCPLILDDVTVHADAERTEAMLDVLAELALTRQIIMFSQEASVRDWAARSGAAVVELPTP